jgi:2-desacetyl-2-hydroxyethyl bacteriochlorophyllide A dehydrogenase
MMLEGRKKTVVSNPTVVFVEPRRVTIEDRPRPVPGEGELLVQTSRTLISTGTELTILSGEFPPGSKWAEYGKFPFVPGYDHIGVVVEVGSKVDPSWLGRKVASYAPHAAYVTLRPEAVRPVPAAIPDEEAAFFTLAEIVMNGVRRGEVRWGEAVVVYGLGLLGQLTARCCHFAGARPVIGVDVSEERLKRLPQAPGFQGVNPGRQNLVEIVREQTQGRMADVAFEVTGNPELIPREFEALKRQGRLVILSSPRGPTSSFDFHDLCNSPSYTLIGAHNSSHPPVETPSNPWTQKRHAELFFHLLASGEWEVKPLISHRAPYTEAPRLYEMLLEDRTQAMGVVLEW